MNPYDYTYPEPAVVGLNRRIAELEGYIATMKKNEDWAAKEIKRLTDGCDRLHGYIADKDKRIAEQDAEIKRLREGLYAARVDMEHVGLLHTAGYKIVAKALEDL